MASERQLAANRRNALMSTGPRSLARKARSSQNAVVHGLTSQQAMLPGEDPAEFAGLRQAMFNSLDPQGALENQLVERVASLIWRMRRFQAFEVALFKWTTYLQSARYDHSSGPPNERRNDPYVSEDAVDEELKDQLRVGRMLEALLSGDLTSRLSRYETSMQRHLSLTLKELGQLKLLRQLANRPAEPERADDDEWVEYKGRRVKRIGPP